MKSDLQVVLDDQHLQANLAKTRSRVKADRVEATQSKFFSGILKKMPVVMFMGYSVHGNEAERANCIFTCG